MLGTSVDVYKKLLGTSDDLHFYLVLDTIKVAYKVSVVGHQYWIPLRYCWAPVNFAIQVKDNVIPICRCHSYFMIFCNIKDIFLVWKLSFIRFNAVIFSQRYIWFKMKHFLHFIFQSYSKIHYEHPNMWHMYTFYEKHEELILLFMKAYAIYTVYIMIHVS